MKTVRKSLVAVALLHLACSAMAYTITFDNLTGQPQYSAYHGSTEGGFTIQPYSPGGWGVDTFIGGPAPSIYTRYSDGMLDYRLRITSSSGTFSCTSLDYFNGGSPVFLNGLLGGLTVFYTAIGAVNAEGTYYFSQPSTQIDELDILASDLLYLDNIVVEPAASVPDCGTTWVLLLIGFSGLALCRRYKK